MNTRLRSIKSSHSSVPQGHVARHIGTPPKVSGLPAAMQIHPVDPQGNPYRPEVVQQMAEARRGWLRVYRMRSRGRKITEISRRTGFSLSRVGQILAKFKAAQRGNGGGPRPAENHWLERDRRLDLSRKKIGRQIRTRIAWGSGP